MLIFISEQDEYVNFFNFFQSINYLKILTYTI